MITWHLPHRGRLLSESEQCSFLAQKDNIYVMDNHRCALWCWKNYLQSQNLNQVNFFHLDAHEDAKNDLATSIWDELDANNVEKYLNQTVSDGSYKLFRWDNYLPVWVHADQKQIRKSVFATHEVGLAGFSHQRINPYQLLTHFPKLFVDELPWVINLDADYFYPKELKQTPLFHPEVIDHFFRQLKHFYDQGDIALITFALSPECCGSWDNAEKIFEVFEKYFQTGIKF